MNYFIETIEIQNQNYETAKENLLNLINLKSEYKIQKNIFLEKYPINKLTMPDILLAIKILKTRNLKSLINKFEEYKDGHFEYLKI